MEIVDRLLEEEQNVSFSFLFDLAKVNVHGEHTTGNLLKNNILNTSQGLFVLKSLLPSLNDDDLQEKAVHYFSSCLRFTKRSESNFASLAYSVLAELFKRCRKFSEIEKCITTQTFADLFHNSLPKVGPNEHLESLKCIEIVLTEYPKQCLSFRPTIEKYLIEFLDSNDDSLVLRAAKCCHILQQVRPAADKAANPKSSWRAQVLLLCNVANKLLDKLFETTGNIYSSYFKTTDSNMSHSSTLLNLNLDKLTEEKLIKNIIDKNSKLVPNLSPTEKVNLITNRLLNILTFLQAMLVDTYPFIKTVRPITILDLIVRLLSLSTPKSSQGDGSLTLLALATSVPKFKMAALRTLEAIMVCLETDLVPYSPLIIRLVAQSIKWSHDNQSKAGNEVRIAAYKTLARWLNLLKCEKLNLDENSKEANILEAILDDVTPHQTIVQLKLGSHSTKNMSKKAKRKMAKNALQESSISSYAPGFKNVTENGFEDTNLTICALETLEMILGTSGRFFKPPFHKKIQNMIIKQCYEQRRCTNNEKFSNKHLLALYKVLEACRVSVPSALRRPDQYCLDLFSIVDSADYELSKFCSNAIQAIRLSIHAVPSSISFAPDYSSDEEERQSNQKQLSERNRAALALHLGETRLHEIDLTNETAKDNSILLIENEDKHNKQTPIILTPKETTCEVSSSCAKEGEAIDVTETSSDEDIQLVEPQPKKLKFDTADEVDSLTQTLEKETKIHYMETQLPLDTSKTAQSDTSEECEVMYDDNYVTPTRLTIPPEEAVENDPLPSTNESDKLPCAQVQTKQDDVAPSGNDAEKTQNNIELSSEGKTEGAQMNGELTVDEMIADFVE